MIGISLLTLVPGELGGSETYVRELLRALAREGTLEYVVFAPPVAPKAGGGLPTVVVDEYPAGRTAPGRLAAMGVAAMRAGRLRGRLEPVQAIHFPLTIALPPPRRPYVSTLLDVQHLDLPHMFSRAERAFRAVAWHRSVRSADIIIAISDFVRERAIERLGLAADRVHTVYLGVDHERLRPGESPREPMLLYPARSWPHKNHGALLAAFALLREKRPELRLILTGGGHEHTPAAPGVDVRGYVSTDELVALYQQASCLVFPSLYEGFGQPPLEAMACGCPVAAANAGSLPEVCGGAARLFDPTSPQEIATAVLEVLDDPEPWRSRGFEQARRFTWEATARQHEQLYRELLP